MHSRLLSFLSNFERAIIADDPSPDEGTWDAERTVNYKNGLARLTLAVKHSDRPRQPRGGVLIQGFKLADGSPCLKLQFSWAGTEASTTHAIFDKPGSDWKYEARKAAALWMAGPPAPAVTATPVEEEVAVAAAS
ncbi:MAG TPA: hypothetical protein VG734_10385 [Lacunisphaera sp.]|nr:hypothetical protein [Lacunisphaera sp.]